MRGDLWQLGWIPVWSIASLISYTQGNLPLFWLVSIQLLLVGYFAQWARAEMNRSHTGEERP